MQGVGRGDVPVSITIILLCDPSLDLPIMLTNYNDAQDCDLTVDLPLLSAESEALEGPAIHVSVNSWNGQGGETICFKDGRDTVEVKHRAIDPPVERVWLSGQVTQDVNIGAVSFHHLHWDFILARSK